MIAARRFFVEGAKEIGETVEIGGTDAHKIANVLRLNVGDRVVVIDSAARTFTATIAVVGRVVRTTIEEEIFDDRAPSAALRIDVAQAVPKGRRMDFVLEKGSELGVETFLPFYCERSVSRDVGGEKAARWQRIARSAAQQCGRKSIPTVIDPLPYETLLERFGEYDAVLFAWELATPAPLQRRLADALPASGRALVVVGPEGGFTHAEAELAQRRGAAMLWLGPRVLRTDTAALVLLAVIGAATS
ncbi:MAG: RsmE family RNA methyltransferase [Candidatus Cybelea sp.]